MSTATSDTLPSACAIAFKEWEGVCLALETGRQSIILRKGGIAEGPAGFVPEHPAFWLYPTRVHQAQQGLKVVSTPDEDTTEGAVGLRVLAVVSVIARVDREERLRALDDLHVWTSETVEARFRYKRPGLWVLGVRVYRRPEAFSIPVTPEHAGCKTWVPLDRPLSTEGLVPVLDEPASRESLDRLRARVEVGPNR